MKIGEMTRAMPELGTKDKPTVTFKRLVLSPAIRVKSAKAPPNTSTVSASPFGPSSIRTTWALPLPLLVTLIVHACSPPHAPWVVTGVFVIARLG